MVIYSYPKPEFDNVVGIHIQGSAYEGEKEPKVSIWDWLTSHGDMIQQYAAAFGIPFSLICLSALAEKLVRGQGWKWKYFYLGVDLTLAAMSAALVNLADAALPGNKSLPAGSSAKSAVFLAGTLFLLFVLMGFQQDYGHIEKPTKGQICMLVFASNLAATGVFFGFILMKLKGLL
ncbi:MAG: hypothetical protein ACLP6G_11070 [Terriglobales bacterium]